MKKQYELKYHFEARMVIEIGHEVFTPEIFKGCSEFWSNKPDLEDWLVMVYMIALRESVASTSGTRSLIEGKEEGFPKFDGSEGISIVEFDEFEFDDFNVDFMELSSND